MIRIFRWMKILIGVLLLGLLVLLLVFAGPVAKSVGNGVQICLTVLIPSLFLFLIVSDFTVKTGCANVIIKPFGFLCSKLFHVDRSLGALLLMSLCCGYPVGAKLLREMVQRGSMSAKTASRMLAFCVNAGPAFLIGAVAVPLFGDLRFGIVLFAAQICGFFAVGMLSGIGKKTEPCPADVTPPAYAQALVDSVSSATRAMVNICAFVLLFSGLIGLLNLSGFTSAIASAFSSIMPQSACEGAIYGLLEISNGILFLQNVPHTFGLVVVLSSFGGLCVHFQIMAMVKECSISMKPFYLYRTVYIIVSLLAANLLLGAFHLEMQTMAMQPGITPENFSAAPLGSLFLIILSITLLLCDKKSATIERR